MRPSLNPIYGDVGFRFTWDTTGVPSGKHTLYVLAEGKESWHYNLVPITIGSPETDQGSSGNAQVCDIAVEQNRVPAQDRAATDMNQALTERDAEIACLQALVSGYEQGRFIRLMKWWHSLRQRGRTSV